MFQVFEGYSTYEIVQSTSSTDLKAAQNINDFVTLGWDILSVSQSDKVELTQLGWLSSKGSAVYPKGLEPNKQTVIDLRK